MALTIDEQTPPQPKAAKDEIALSGDAADAYVARLRKGIRAARLNALFPPARALAQHMAFLGPTGSEGIYNEIRLAVQNGMPSAREILRVRIDKDLATDFLVGAVQHRLPAVGSPLDRRVKYYGRLAGADVMPTHRMHVDLRQQLPEEDTALFRILFDRFDLATATFCRYTILLKQRDSLWAQPHVVVDDNELALPTEAFRRTIGRFTGHEAELAFVLLSKLKNIVVEDVRRCRIGPMLMPGVRGIGKDIEDLLGDGEEPRWILCFPEDRAGIEVARHSSGDPLAPLYRDAVSGSASELIDAKADELGYRVAKSRKFACSSNIAPQLSALCSRLGSPCIVRGAPP